MPTARRPAFLPSGEGCAVPTPWPEELIGKIDGTSTGGAFSVAELVPTAGWSRPPYTHHVLDECFYVAAGSFVATVDTALHPLELTAGSILFVPRGALRSIRVTALDSRLLVVSTPGQAPDALEPATGIEFTEPGPPRSTRIPSQPQTRSSSS